MVQSPRRRDERSRRPLAFGVLMVVAAVLSACSGEVSIPLGGSTTGAAAEGTTTTAPGTTAVGVAVTSASTTGAGDVTSTQQPSAGLSTADPTAQAASGDGTSVLEALAAGGGATADGVAQELDALLEAGALGTVSASVTDVATGTTLLSQDADEAVAGASTTKLLTATAVLQVYGPQATFDTRVVATDADAPVVLVGGGDVLLDDGASDPDAVDGHAGLATLAESTAEALTAQGRTSVALRVDDTLFDGARAADWDAGDVAGGYVAPVMALALHGGSTGSSSIGEPQRSSDPAMAAATAFAEALEDAGITVTGKVKRGTAAADATTLATVSSAPLAEVVEFFLTYSDNTVAEAMARMVAVGTDAEATFAGAAAAVTAVLADAGVDTEGLHLTGGSGLGQKSRLTTTALVDTLALAASADAPHLRAAVTGMPVAGATGTLDDRFTRSSQSAALGVVRAKTGTLTGVNALSGVLVDADGDLLAFAFVANGTSNALRAESALDSLAAALVGCGCQG